MTKKEHLAILETIRQKMDHMEFLLCDIVKGKTLRMARKKWLVHFRPSRRYPELFPCGLAAIFSMHADANDAHLHFIGYIEDLRPVIARHASHSGDPQPYRDLQDLLFDMEKQHATARAA